MVISPDGEQPVPTFVPTCSSLSGLQSPDSAILGHFWLILAILGPSGHRIWPFLVPKKVHSDHSWWRATSSNICSKKFKHFWALEPSECHFEPFGTKKWLTSDSLGPQGPLPRPNFWSNSSNTNLTWHVKVRRSPGKWKVFAPQPHQYAIFGLFSTFWTSEPSSGPSGAKIGGPEG